MILKTKLLAAGAALLLSAGSAMAVPATAETDLNVRSGPGTQFPVIGTLSNGEAVDVDGCTGSWCQVSFGGGTGYANRSYLAMGGAVAPGPAVTVSPFVYDDDYYDYGYTYGPSVGFYAGPRFHRHWRGRHHGWRGHAGNWQGRSGNWGGRGNWTGRPGWSGNRVGNIPSGMNRAGGRPSVSAPVGMSRGPVAGGAQIGAGRGGAGVFHGGAGAAAAGGGSSRR